jgi:nitric oxide dioxygenase
MELTAKIKEIVVESPRVKRFIFSCSFDFVPGQWVNLWSDSYKIDEKSVRRAYSIASNPGEALDLCIAKGKRFSAFMNDDAKVGDEFHIQGPFGKFELKDNNKVFFIAAGTGIVPFIPMIKKSIEQGREIVLLYSARSREEILFKDWLDSIRANVNVIITLTREETAEYDSDRIPILLPKYFKKGFDYYLCGYSDFLQETESELKKLGVENIYFDKWG